MDSRTHLDYALFQLTPTRTRCDLVISAGNKNEKLASGLLEPFLSHLKYAKDQISKGGYSITLRPTSSNASWFTKATLERFVKFVSTPEILERFVTIEREIAQIENSIQLNEQTNGANEAEGANLRSSAATTKIDSNGSGDDTPEKNSKVQLLRVLETRKAVLRKEQAMAYARALVAGFETDKLEDLILFSDVFGAARLREACMNFMELCHKKSNDGIWMDEVAAMRASHAEFSFLGTSGILLAGEGNDGNLYSRQQHGQADTSASDSATSLGSLDTSLDNHLPKIATEQSTERKAQVPPWGPYVHNFQGPGYQKMPPYQGYFFPGMQVPQSYYPANVQWPPNGDDANFSIQPDDIWKRVSSKRKDKIPKGARQDSEQNDNNEPSQSSSASDSDESEGRERGHTLGQLHKKKSGKSSSRKVVIRNINYITSKKNGEGSSSSESDLSDGEELIDADSLKQQVDEALGSFERRHKSKSFRSKKKELKKKESNELNDDADKDTGKTVSSNPAGETRSRNWDFFQDLLMKDADSIENDTNAKTQEYTDKITGDNSGERKSLSLSVQSEEVSKHRGISADSFLSSERSVDNDGRHIINFEAAENGRGVIKRGNAEQELLFLQRVQGSEMYSRPPLSDSGVEPLIVKSQREEDWIIGNRPDEETNQGERVGQNIFNGNDTSVFTSETLQITENKKYLVDDSFMIQAGLMTETTHSELKTDIFLESDISGSNNSKPDDLQDKVATSNTYEPDDLYMVIGRSSAAEEVAMSWNPEMDYLNDNSVAEGLKRQSDVEPSDSVDLRKLPNGKSTNNITSRSPGGKVSNKQAKPTVGSLARSKSEPVSRNKKVPGSKTMVQKSKAEQEEEKRKKMEQLLIQRQKRIAERSAGGVSTTVASRMTSKEHKKAPLSAKNVKITQHAPLEETKKSLKPIFRSSTVDRLSAARTIDKRSSTESEVGPKMATTKANNTRAASVQKSVSQNKKLNQDKVKASDKKFEIKDSSRHSAVSETPKRDDKLATAFNPKEESGIKATPPVSFGDDSEVIKKLDHVSSTQKDERDINSMGEAYKESDLSPKNLPEPAEGHSAQADHSEVKVEVISKASLNKETIVADDIPGSNPQKTGYPLVSTNPSMDENNVASEKLCVSPKSPITETSTPPPNIEPSAETNYYRKKWNNGETSPKLTKGFRKLLLFGRKS